LLESVAQSFTGKLVEREAKKLLSNEVLSFTGKSARRGEKAGEEQQARKAAGAIKGNLLNAKLFFRK
jgi:hypothetical protein